MRLFTIVSISVYSILIMFSNVIVIVKSKKIDKGNLLLLLGSIFMMISVALAINNLNNIIILLISLILIQVGTIFNGYRMYGKPNISHNIIKIIIAIVMILLYMKL